MARLEKCRAIPGPREQSPPHAVGETDARCFVAVGDFATWAELCASSDANVRSQHFAACRCAHEAIVHRRYGEYCKVLGG